ncbi:hypothetical protein [Allonocardiopsis opalescens]|uniref:hypothetical protein n=1 Tax=Allonocardiopsis opalescens TaxID=1144618 RepID=UPI0011B26EA2|nr:hypothetical protein [Allonocardiopsis opalescens]
MIFLVAILAASLGTPAWAERVDRRESVSIAMNLEISLNDEVDGREGLVIDALRNGSVQHAVLRFSDSDATGEYFFDGERSDRLLDFMDAAFIANGVDRPALSSITIPVVDVDDRYTPERIEDIVPGSVRSTRYINVDSALRGRQDSAPLESDESESRAESIDIANWAPSYYRASMYSTTRRRPPDYDVTVPVRLFEHWFRWDAQQGHSPILMPDDWGIEIEVSLYNNDPGGLIRPFCTNVEDGDPNHFSRGYWASEQIEAWTSSIPSSAEPYLDDVRLSDACNRNAIAIGVGRPVNISHDANYFVSMYMIPGTATTSEIWAGAQAVSHDCPGVAQSICMDLNTEREFPVGDGEKGAPYANRDRNFSAPGCVQMVDGWSAPVYWENGTFPSFGSTSADYCPRNR